jgi:hypothetical protein
VVGAAVVVEVLMSAIWVERGGLWWRVRDEMDKKYDFAVMRGSGVVMLVC